MKLWWGVTSLRFRFYSFLFYMCFHLTQLIKGVLLDPAATNWSMWGWHNGRSLGRLVAPCYAKDCQLLHLYLWHSILFQTADAAINVLDSMLATSCLIFFWGLPIAGFFSILPCAIMWGHECQVKPLGTVQSPKFPCPLAPAHATANGVPDRQSLIARRGANAKRFQRASLGTKELEPTSPDFQISKLF